MASQLINDGFFPAHILGNRKSTGQAAARLTQPRGTSAQQLVGLSIAELSERSATIEAEIDELGRILGVFLVGLVVLGLVIALVA